MIDSLEKPAGKRINLPCGLNFTIEYDRYLLGTDSAALSPYPTLADEFGINIPGRTSIPGWEIEAVVGTPTGKMSKHDEFTAFFDFDKAGDRLTVRRRQPGDRFQPLGMDEPKKLNVFMIDARIPQAWRRRIPIVTSPEQIVWVVGSRIDERVKVSLATNIVLRLVFKRR